MASNQTRQFEKGLPIHIIQGTRQVSIDHGRGSAVVHFHDTFMEKSFTLSCMDFNFLKDNMEQIEKALTFKNREAHEDCFNCH